MWTGMAAELFGGLAAGAAAAMAGTAPAGTVAGSTFGKAMGMAKGMPAGTAAGIIMAPIGAENAIACMPGIAGTIMQPGGGTMPMPKGIGAWN